MQLQTRGHLVQAFADVALYCQVVLCRKLAQAFQEGGGAGRNEARRHNRIDQGVLQLSATTKAPPPLTSPALPSPQQKL